MFGSDAFSPQEITEKVERVSVTKARLPILQTLMLGVLAGGFIGLGALYFTLVVSEMDRRAETISIQDRSGSIGVYRWRRLSSNASIQDRSKTIDRGVLPALDARKAASRVFPCFNVQAPCPGPILPTA